MVRYVFIAIVGLCCVCTVSADDMDGREADQIALELKKAKDEYQSSIENAGKKMLAAFDEQLQKLQDNKTMKVDLQIKQIEQLQRERKEFESDSSKLPASMAMKVASTALSSDTSQARKRLEDAFTRSAEAYRSKKDFVSAKAALSELEEFKTKPSGNKKNKDNESSSKLPLARDGLTKALVGTSWQWKEQVLTFNADGTAEIGSAKPIPWVVIDADKVILQHVGGDYDILKFSSDRKAFEKDWIGKPSGRAYFKCNRIEKKQ